MKRYKSNVISRSIYAVDILHITIRYFPKDHNIKFKKRRKKKTEKKTTRTEEETDMYLTDDKKNKNI